MDASESARGEERAGEGGEYGREGGEGEEGKVKEDRKYVCCVLQMKDEQRMMRQKRGFMVIQVI